MHSILGSRGTNLGHGERKGRALFEFYDSLMGVSVQRSTTINLDLLNLLQLELSGLAKWFTEEEVLQVICSLPSDKAPSPPRGFCSLLER
jgi:hypothetical protein